VTSTQRRSDETPARDQYVAVNGMRLHYREFGEVRAEPLLILHGLTGHAWEFDALASALAAGHSVFALDQRGHGASAWAERYSPELMAADIVAFADALDLERISVVGHSMGGVNAWWFASAFGNRLDRLIVVDVDPWTITSPKMAAAWSEALRGYAAARYGSREEAVTEYLQQYNGRHRSELRRFVLHNLEARVGEGWGWRFDAAGLVTWMENASDLDAHLSALRQVTSPTLIVRAGDSAFTSASSVQRMAEALPDARIVEIAHSDHDIHIEQCQALAKAIASFTEPSAMRA
jgi:pimeloyl-ACP methyl ester carboxylesterase